MVKLNFSDTNFKGFEDGEDILIDTCVILAYLEGYNGWHDAVNELFKNHIFANPNTIFLYINPCIANELLHLVNDSRSIKEYTTKTGIKITDADIEATKKQSVNSIKQLIEKEILLVLDANKDVYLNHLDLYEKLGSADAFNAAVANEYGINFLTVDNKLVGNMIKHQYKLPNIEKVYYAPGSVRKFSTT